MTLPIAHEWFAATMEGAGITRLYEPHVHELLRSNLFHVRGRDADLLVDTGCGVALLAPQFARLGLTGDRPLVAVATHAHVDHVGGMHEFETRMAHPEAAVRLSAPGADFFLCADAMPPAARTMLADAGVDLPQLLIDALPSRSFDPTKHVRLRAAPTREVVEGAVVDLGDRRFEVLHLPGHSPDSIGLWDAEAGILFAGDAIYDGPLLDDLPGGDVRAYCETMRRLRDLPVTVVHGGHDPSFGRARMIEIAEDYLARREPDAER